MEAKEVANELRCLAEKLERLADSLGDSDKKEEPKIEFVDLRKKLAEKSRAGFTSDIKEILKKHGSDKLSELDQKEYEAVLQEVEALS